MANSGNDKKAKFEAAVLSLFLADQGLTYAPRNHSDPDHDGWAMKGEQRIAELELTRYVVDGGKREGSHQLGAVGLWNNNVWPAVETRRRNRPELRHIMASVAFSDRPLRKRDVDALANQLIDVTAKAWAERNAQKPLPFMKPQPVTSVVIEDRSGLTANFQDGHTAYIHPDPILFPEVVAHIQRIQLTETSEEWPEWWGPDMQGGTVSCGSEVLCRILKEKTDKLNRRLKMLGSTGLPVWLVILCDLLADTRTMIYPRSEDQRHAVQSMFASCQYDFTQCPFAQVWLMSQAYDHSMRIELPSIR